MSFYSKVGSFNIDTAKTVGQTQSISGLGFQPKIVIFWWSGGTSADTTAGGDFNLGFGAATSSTARYCSHAFEGDALASTRSSKTQYNDRVIVANSAQVTVDGYMDFSSMDADGFSLIVDDQFTISLRVSYVALGGTELTNVKVGQIASIPASTGNYATTGTGFQPDALIAIYDNRNAFGSASTNGAISIGIATGSSNQGVVSLSVLDSVTTTNTVALGISTEIISAASASGTHPNTRSSFVSFDSDGFTLNCLEVGTSGRYGWYVALKGGQYAVGNLLTETGSSQITETVNFQPSAILFLSANRAEDTTDTQSDHAKISIGAATSTSNRAAQAVYSEDALTTSEVATGTSDAAVYINIAHDANVGLMDVSAINSNGFTCIMDDYDPAQSFVTYLAIAGTASTASDNNPAYLKGSSASSSEKDAYLKGSRAFEVEWAVVSYKQGSAASASSLKYGYLKGQATYSGNKPAYLSGTTSAQSASSHLDGYMKGKALGALNKPAYLQGKATFNHKKPAYLSGIMGASAHKDAYLKGRVMVSSLKSACIPAVARSKKSAYLKVRLTVNSPKPAYLCGYVYSGDSCITLMTEDGLFSKKFVVLQEGYDDGTLNRSETKRRTIEGYLDISLGESYNTWSAMIKVREEESKSGYGTLHDLEQFYKYNTPAGSRLIYIDHHSRSYTVKITGKMNKSLVGVGVEGTHAWYLYRITFVEI